MTKSDMVFKKNNKHESGFTLIETLVALFILTFAIVAPLSLAFDAMKSSRATEGGLTAFYLAQEGVEYAKNLRDSVDPTAGGDWLGALKGTSMGLGHNCVSAAGSRWCQIDTNDSSYSNAIKQCSPNNFNGCNYLIHDGISYRLGGAGETTIFKRGLKVERSSDTSPQAKITVRVEWEIDDVVNKYELSQWVFNVEGASEKTIPICGNGICEVKEHTPTRRCDMDCGQGGGGVDFDGDGWPDASDNCWCVSNPGSGGVQWDGDGDGVGNKCDWDHVNFSGVCCDANCGR